MGGIEAALAEHAFEHLFIECLGWDRVRTSVSIEHRDIRVELTAIAQKRGFTVFLCPAHRTVLANRGLLRDVQRQLRRSCHEHIVIHCCEAPLKQVWQWATMAADKRRILHREHPFFSNEPPPRLLERIEGLEIGVDEEERTNLVDVLDRVRSALLPDSELNLFTKHPKYAVQSDRLALAMRNGDSSAFEQFVLLHRPLVRHASKRLIRWFGMDPEDAEQTAMIGLIVAARRWDPERGYQFSTYAHHWLLHACERYGQKWGTWFHLPAHWFFQCYRLTFARSALAAAYGEREAESRFDDELRTAGLSRQQWAAFCASRHVDHLTDFSPTEVAELKITKGSTTFDEACADELAEDTRQLLRFLPEREADILRMRYGIGCNEHTLEEVAIKLGVTRERIRQIQIKAEERLLRHFGATPFDEPIAKQIPSETVETTL